MKYTIIKNSESHTGYDIPDKEYKGMISGLCCGWQWEYVNDKGEIDYSSVSFTHMTPEEYAGQFKAYDGGDWIHETPSFNGWKPTGRVVFRGYARDYYDPDEREWFVEDVEI